MAVVINTIACIVLIYFIYKIYWGERQIVVNPINETVKCYINRDLSFLVFSIATAMAFLGPLSLVKYGIWIIVLIWRSCVSFKIKVDSIVASYLMFFVWAVFCFFNSTVKFQGLMLLIKYMMPLMYLWLSYSAIEDKYDFVYLLKTVAVIMLVYSFIIGGFSAKFLPWLYGYLCFGTGGLFISYASLADFYSALIVVPIGLFFLTHKRKWLYLAGWIAMSTVLEVVRTGMGAMFLAGSFMIIAIFKLKSIPIILAAGIVGFSAALSIPSVREKMFIEQTSHTSTNGSVDIDNIQTNGRAVIWEKNMDIFFDPHPLVGSGLGESMEYTKNNFTVKLIHSDYVQMLCDMGIIGVVLFGLAFVVAILKILSIVWSRRCESRILKVCGGMVLGSYAAVLFSMGFDNVISYTQQCFVLPFVFVGAFLKLIDLEKIRA